MYDDAGWYMVIRCGWWWWWVVIRTNLLVVVVEDDDDRYRTKVGWTHRCADCHDIFFLRDAVNVSRSFSGLSLFLDVYGSNGYPKTRSFLGYGSVYDQDFVLTLLLLLLFWVLPKKQDTRRMGGHFQQLTKNALSLSLSIESVSRSFWVILLIWASALLAVQRFYVTDRGFWGIDYRV